MSKPVKEGEQYCNYKQNPDGSRGEKVGCSDTLEKAQAELRKLNMVMAEENKQVVRPTQEETGYITLSTTKGKACANCRWFAKEGREREMEEEIEGGYCHLIENWPADVLATGYCERWEIKPDMNAQDPLEVVIVEDQRSVEEPEPEVEYGYLAPSSNKTGFIQSLKARLPGLKPGQTVFRDADGRRYMFIVTSNSFEDRTSESIASKALERYVDSCWLAEDYFKSNNVHQVWHHDALTVGDIVWADMSGPFLLEISKARDDIVSKTVWDYWESEEGSKDLGASLRFWRRKQDKLADGTLPIISKFETSTLPRRAAANLLTYSGVIPMSKARDEYLDGIFGIKGVAELLKDGPQKLAEKLAEAGVEHKSVDEPTPEEAIDTAKDQYGALLLQMIEDLAATHESVDKLTEGIDQKDLQRDEKFTTLEQQLKALADDNLKLREAMKESPRASQSATTVVHDDQLKTEIENKSVTYDPMFPGMQVPMEK